MKQVEAKARGLAGTNIVTWERPDLGGNQLISPILEAIKKCEIFIADITILNFNVTYELGYAIGLGKRVIPVRCSAFASNNDAIQKVGIYDTIIRQEYSASDELFSYISVASTGRRLATEFAKDPVPLYVVLPSSKINDVGQIRERAQRAGLRSRAFDPSENPRLGPTEAVRAVAVSSGIIVPLISPELHESVVHNLRAAFVAGIAHALEKPTLIVKHGDWGVPLDIRDETSTYYDDKQLGSLIVSFSARVHDVLFSEPPETRGRANLLSEMNIGDPAAENEEAQLVHYFLERGEYRQILEQRTNIVVGRKGSGKTAVFVRVRDQLKADRANIVLDLSPETHELKRLKDVVLNCLAAGSKEFLLSAFWDYVLLLEIARKTLDKDQDVHKRNHNLFEPYQRLLAVFRAETATSGADFSERLQLLINRIAEVFEKRFGATTGAALSQAQLTNLLYQTTLADLRRSIESYVANKKGIYILFDNIDKGWNANGLEPADIVIVRTLLDSGRRLENDFGRTGIAFHCTVFLRNDIYDMLISGTSDRGKETKTLVDWPQASLLKQMVRRRLQYALNAAKSASVDELWYKISVALMNDEHSLDFLVRHCLMRPRYLLRLINHCIGNAVNFSRDKIDEDDIQAGLSAYSTDIVTEVDLEIRDVFGKTQDVLYVFLGESRSMPKSQIEHLIAKKIDDSASQYAVFTLLIWHGVLGLIRPDHQDATYIYDVHYDMKRMVGLVGKYEGGDPLMEINPGLWAGLELT